MYVPPSFRETDVVRLHEFIEQHSFGTLISAAGDDLVASHLPLLLDRGRGPHGTLAGHMARANSHWEAAAGRRALAVFHGPHAYISPTWYAAENVVPTWNYVAVHASGILRLVEDRDRLLETIRRTVDRYESSRAAPWPLESQSPGFLARMLDAIVGFEIDLDRIEGKWKLSQNHPVERRRRVIDGLKEVGGFDAGRIADLMEGAL